MDRHSIQSWRTGAVAYLLLWAVLAGPGCHAAPSSFSDHRPHHQPDDIHTPHSSQPGSHPAQVSTDAGIIQRLLRSMPSTARVVVVNDIPGHFEVLAGILYILSGFRLKPHVLYVGAPNIPVTWGLLEWLGMTRTPEWEQLPRTGSSGAGDQPAISQLDTQIATWHPLQMMESVAESGLSADLVLCISAELAPEVCKKVAQALNPTQLAVVVHRADALSQNARILSLYHNTAMFALAPHVANMAQQRLRTPVSWALPICPHVPVRGACQRLSCLHGFTIQGALRRYRNKNTSGYTRNYMQLWQRLVELKRAAALQQPQPQLQQLHGPGEGEEGERPGPRHSMGGGVFGTLSSGSPVQVTVLGKGTRVSLGIPTELDLDVQFYSRLPYQEFWGRIHHSLALVPSLGHEEYYLSRITSTVIASLITATPIIAEQRLLDAYQFLRPEHVFLRLPDEDEASAMHRIASMSEAEVLARRRALVQLRQSLNKQAVELMEGWLQKAAGGKAGA